MRENLRADLPDSLILSLRSEFLERPENCAGRSTMVTGRGSARELAIRVLSLDVLDVLDMRSSMGTKRFLTALAALAFTVTLAGTALAQQSGQYQQQGQYAPYPPANAGPNQGYPPQMGQYPPNVVPEGTSLLVRLTDTLDVNKASPGKRFEG
jgi:hypothetical protein